jgi:hypothetical protein
LSLASNISRIIDVVLDSRVCFLNKLTAPYRKLAYGDHPLLADAPAQDRARCVAILELAVRTIQPGDRLRPWSEREVRNYKGPVGSLLGALQVISSEALLHISQQPQSVHELLIRILGEAGQSTTWIFERRRFAQLTERQKAHMARRQALTGVTPAILRLF